MSEIDDLWAQAIKGDPRELGDWMGRVERPIRRSLQPFARVVDAEGVVQETLLRMCLFAQKRRVELTGENASLRWAIVMARRIAQNEARKRRPDVLLPPENMPEPAIEPEPLADPFLARAIRECLGALTGKPLAAMRARLGAHGMLSDKALAATLRMNVNTFLQNIVRARRQIEQCLAAKGVSLEEALR